MKNILLFVFLCFMQKNYCQTLYFPPTSGNIWETLEPSSLNYCPEKIAELYTFLEENNSKSFILLKDGKIVLEQYFNNHTQNSPWYWASAGKTITAFMTGIAQQENFLQISDTTSTYLENNWTSAPLVKEEKITIKNQLSMTSGLNDAVSDPFCTLPSCLEYLADAGTRWAYHNGPYTLLDQVIENATGVSLNTYTTLKLKNPTGMTGSFIVNGFNNIFFSTARSMARFGLLILNDGNWNGNQIMTDTNYFNEMVNTSQNINKSYGYLWWLNGKESFMLPQSQFVFQGSLCPDAPNDMILAAGRDGQFINVVPSQNLVWIRMGEEPSGVSVPFLLNNEIWQKINNLVCNLSLNETSAQEIQTYPNPANETIIVKTRENLKEISIFQLDGKKIKHYENLASTECLISVNYLENGVYIMKIITESGVVLNKKIIKN